MLRNRSWNIKKGEGAFLKISSEYLIFKFNKTLDHTNKHISGFPHRTTAFLSGKYTKTKISLEHAVP